MAAAGAARRVVAADPVTVPALAGAAGSTGSTGTDAGAGAAGAGIWDSAATSAAAGVVAACRRGTGVIGRTSTAGVPRSEARERSLFVGVFFRTVTVDPPVAAAAGAGAAAARARERAGGPVVRPE